jgi:hypothetical protein
MDRESKVQFGVIVARLLEPAIRRSARPGKSKLRGHEASDRQQMSEAPMSHRGRPSLCISICITVVLHTSEASLTSAGQTNHRRPSSIVMLYNSISYHAPSIVFGGHGCRASVSRTRWLSPSNENPYTTRSSPTSAEPSLPEVAMGINMDFSCVCGVVAVAGVLGGLSLVILQPSCSRPACGQDSGNAGDGRNRRPISKDAANTQGGRRRRRRSVCIVGALIVNHHVLTGAVQHARIPLLRL